MMKKYIKAARPATLTVALISTLLGISIAYREGYLFNSVIDILKLLLVVIAGLLLQSSMNMMNNFFEEEVKEDIKKTRKYSFLGYIRSYDEIVTFKIGIAFYVITAFIGIFLAINSGMQLFIIELIGILAAYGYAGEPINYKKYGLGVLISFVMMGPLMVYASYYVFSKSFSFEPILFSFTSGLFIPCILLGNELRDYEEDKNRGVKTLTVRLGSKAGRFLYYVLIALAYANTFLLIFLKHLSLFGIIVLSTLPMLRNIKYYMDKDKRRLIPLTAKLFLAFSFELLLVIVLTK